MCLQSCTNGNYIGTYNLSEDSRVSSERHISSMWVFYKDESSESLASWEGIHRSHQFSIPLRNWQQLDTVQCSMCACVIEFDVRSHKLNTWGITNAHCAVNSFLQFSTVEGASHDTTKTTTPTTTAPNKIISFI